MQIDVQQDVLRVDARDDVRIDELLVKGSF
jgi:hypothetical protein